MRKFGFLIFLCLWGCSASEPISQPAPVANPPVANSPVAATPPPDTKPAQASNKDPRYKPERIYQLADLTTEALNVNGNKISLWKMDNDAKQEEGMMYLEDKDVKPNEGMIFIFDKSDHHDFWMQNTKIPLDIIYVTEKGVVLNIAEGKALSTESLPSKGSCKYVIELKAGISKKIGIKSGSHLKIAN